MDELKNLFIAIFIILMTAAATWAQTPCGAAGFGAAGNASCGNGGVGGTVANQPGSDNSYNVLNFGAKGDGSTNDWAAIEAGYLAAYANHRPLYLPAATYDIDFPLILSSNSTNLSNWNPIKVYGAGGAGPFTGVTTLNMGGVGPGVIMVPPDYTSSLGTISAAPLVGSTGHSFQVNSGQPYFLRLDDVQMQNTQVTSRNPLNGMSALTIQFYFNTSASSGAHPIMASGPKSSAGSGALDLQYTVGGALQAKLNTGGTVTTISGGTVAQNTTYWGALVLCPSSCNDAGENMYLYLATPGATSQSPVAKSSVSGNITQAVGETFSAFMRWSFPPTNNDASQFIGQLYSLDIENTNLYTGAAVTAPNATFTGTNGQTLYLNNGLQIGGSRTEGSTTVNNVPVASVDFWNGRTGVSSGNPFTWQVLWNATFDGNARGQDLEDLGMTGFSTIGFFNAMEPNSYLFRLYAIGASFIGFDSFNNTFNSRWDQLITTGSGAVAGVECGWLVGRLDNPSVGGEAYPIEGWCGTDIHPIVTTSSNAISSIFKTWAFQGFSSDVIIDPEVDEEAGGNPNGIEIACPQNGSGTTTIVGGADIAGGTGSAILVDNGNTCDGISIIGTHLFASGSGAAIAFSNTSPTTPAQVSFNSVQTNAGNFSNKPSWIVQAACGGAVTLIGGTGTLSNVCINSNSNCFAKDVSSTSSVDNCTIISQGAGSLTVGNGNPTDTCKVTCQ